MISFLFLVFIFLQNCVVAWLNSKGIVVEPLFSKIGWIIATFVLFLFLDIAKNKNAKID